MFTLIATTLIITALITYALISIPVIKETIDRNKAEQRAYHRAQADAHFHTIAKKREAAKIAEYRALGDHRYGFLPN